MTRAQRFRKKVMRPIAVVPIIALVGVGAWMRGRSSATTPVAATTVDRTVPVSLGTMRQTVTASGTLAPADTENLSFAVSGKVTAVNVKAGQQVTKGTVLATIDSASLQSQVTQAQASVDSANAKLATDTNNGASSAQLTADRANVAAASSQLADAKAALAGATLVAPIDGTVSVVGLTVGEELGSSGTSGTSLSGSATGSGRTTGSSSSAASSSSSSSAASSSSSSTGQVQIITVGSYVVNLGVDDTEIGRLKAGQVATVTRSSAAGGGQGRTNTNRGGAAATGGASTTTSSTTTPPADTSSASAAGTVTSVGTIATSTSGVATFPVVVTLTTAPSGFYAGAAVQVSITYNQLADVLQVPSLAVTQQAGQSYVTLVEGTKRTQVAVKTGLVSGGQTQVTQGLSAGQQVLVSIPTGAARPGGTTTGNRTGTNGFGGGGGGFGGGGPPPGATGGGAGG